MLYNIAHVICERNTIGNNLIDCLYTNLEYENLWADDKGLFGFQVTANNREQLLANLEEAIRTNSVKINSKRTSDELLTFIITEGGRPAAERGKNDDLVMSLALGIYLYNNLLETAPIEHISKIPHKESLPMPSKQTQHAFRGPGGQIEIEDLRWLMK